MRIVIYLLMLGLPGLVLANAKGAQFERLEIALRNVRFQALPREVRRVHVGPDGRMWFNLDPAQLDPGRASADNIPAFRDRIAREFTQKSPQYYGADLALFEPGGRVWFFLPQHCLLLGFDGKTWIDYVIPDTHDRVIGYCPTRGSCTGGRANRFAQNAAWFVCARGILRFEGNNWSYQPLSDKPQPNPGNVVLAVSPDGRTVAACQTELSTTAAQKYWLFQKCQWISRQVPADDPQNPGANRRLMSMALSDADTLWLVYNNGQLERVGLGGEEPPGEVKDVSDLIHRLADDAFAARERASRELLAMGPSIKPQLEMALKQQPDPEQDYRLKLLLQSFLPKPAAAGSPPASDFGGVRVIFARQLYQDPAGKVGVIAQILRDAQSRQGPGIAVLDDHHQAKAIFTKKLSFSGFNYQNENLPVVAPSGRHSWWPRNLTGESVQLYDAEIDEFIDAAPVPLYGSILAVSAEGSVFLAKMVAVNSGERIMVYTPGAPETRTILKMEKHPVQFPQFSVTDDGAIWALEREENPQLRLGGNWGGKLVRYDGKNWQTPEAQPSQMVQTLTPGKGGVLLMQNQMECILYRGEKEIATGDLVDLIEKHREVFQNSFGPDMTGSAYNPNPRQGSQVLADKAGNIWRLEEGGRLLALVGDRWQLAHEALVAAGSPDGMASYIMPLGDGRNIYLNDRSGTPNRSGAFLGEVKEGKVHFSDAPKIEIRDDESLKARDAEGSVWAACNLKESNGNYRRSMICLGNEGIREKQDFAGIPKAVDAAGNLWVEKSLSPAGCTYKLWRKGEWVEELAVPNVTRSLPLCCDRPGSVYVWTSQGLQRLLADPPDFKQYRLGQLYSIDNLSGEVSALAYSKPGCVVLLMQGGVNNSPWTLGLLKLPEEKNDDRGREKPK
jgi:hypothetical protein